jgi:hypothetical protein
LTYEVEKDWKEIEWIFTWMTEIAYVVKRKQM